MIIQINLAEAILHTWGDSSPGEPRAINLPPRSSLPFSPHFHWGEKSYACDFREIYGWGAEPRSVTYEGTKDWDDETSFRKKVGPSWLKAWPSLRINRLTIPDFHQIYHYSGRVANFFTKLQKILSPDLGFFLEEMKGGSEVMRACVQVWLEVRFASAHARKIANDVKLRHNGPISGTVFPRLSFRDKRSRRRLRSGNSFFSPFPQLILSYF